MSHFRSIFAVIFALGLVTPVAVAEEANLASWCVWRVNEGLLKPLKKKESGRSRFSRSAPVPSERRARVTGELLSQDAQQRGFMPFIVDIRYGDESEWSSDITGCVYRATGAIYVAVGSEYFPAEYLLGKRVEAAPGVCKTKAE